MNQQAFVTAGLDTGKIVERLASFRREWEKAASGKKLTEVSAPIGFVLEDVCEMLELGPDDRMRVLGARCAAAIDAATAG